MKGDSSQSLKIEQLAMRFGERRFRIESLFRCTGEAGTRSLPEREMQKRMAPGSLAAVTAEWGVGYSNCGRLGTSITLFGCSQRVCSCPNRGFLCVTAHRDQ